MYTIGLLTPEHFHWAVHVAGKNMIMHEVKRPELYHRESLEFLANRIMQDETGFIVCKDGKPVGAIGGLLLPSPYNPQITSLSEILWYVLPQHRSSRVGVMLLKEFKKLADDRADEASLTIQLTTPVKIESLEKLGFKFQEQSFIYRVGG